MKSLRLLLPLLLCISSCRKDRLHWQLAEQISTGTTENLNTGMVLQNGMCIIGGGSRFGTAIALRSADAGKSWTLQQLPDDSKGFFGAAESRDGKLFCCGYGLNVYKSSDGFATWSNGRVAGPYSFSEAISFPGTNNGFITVSTTTDTGGIAQCDSNFRLIRYTNLTRAMHDVLMFDEKSGIAVGSGIGVRTDDSGKNWLTLPLTGDNFTSITAADRNLLYTCGLSGYIYKSADGGKTWKRLRNGGNITYPQYRLWDICFANAQEGYAVGENGLVIYTSDGGSHWSELDRFTDKHLRFILHCPWGEWLAGGEQGTLFRLRH
ncbi:hypothetical protein [Rurimicrobium arvi]|uniref:Photosynthesis system II assembly factor Ycf48/Hcf136-like domain-containing protein n=1 Tax=Rurimicrobium arvi TaxID=2049916 RepID=A0ABP8N0C9_9BACT